MDYSVSKACLGCGACIEMCVFEVLELVEENGKPVARFTNQASENCFHCGWCLAVCPVNALTLEGLPASSLEEVETPSCAPEALKALLLRRRSCRSYSDKPVSRELLESVCEAAYLAPVGMPPFPMEITVVPTRDEVEKLLPACYKLLGLMVKLFKNPLAAPLTRLMVGKQSAEMKKRLVPFIAPMLEAWEKRQEDMVAWGAPALLLFHAPDNLVAWEANCWIAATQAMLQAHAHGLGTLFVGLIPPAFNQDSSLRKAVGIPAGHKTAVCLLVGYEKHSPRRAVRKATPRVNWVGSETKQD